MKNIDFIKMQIDMLDRQIDDLSTIKISIEREMEKSPYVYNSFATCVQTIAFLMGQKKAYDFCLRIEKERIDEMF